MVSPVLIKKVKIEESYTVNENANKLFQSIYKEQKKESDKEINDAPKIRVSEVISKMSFFYEKIRNSVDYKEEYLLRKNAIARILKRQIVIERSADNEKISKFLLTELIRAGYLPNNSIPESKIGQIALTIEKYAKFKNSCFGRLSPVDHLKNGRINRANEEMKERSELVNWTISIMASDIEESLGRDKVKQAVVSGMNDYLSRTIELPSDLPYQNDLKIQIYLGIYRNYLKFDNEMLSFILFKYFNSNWDNPDENTILEMGKNISALRKAITEQLNHPIKKQLDKIINRYTVFYATLAEVIEKNPSGVYDAIKNDPKSFPKSIKFACEQKYVVIRSKLWWAAVNSIIYIFLTKSIFVLILEVPAIKWLGEDISYFTLFINICFPAFLLFLAVIFNKIPAEANSDKIFEGIKEIALNEYERKEPILLRRPIKRVGLMNAIFGFIYSITFFITFGLIIWILDKLEFTWVSILIFLFFLAMVSFFSIRIRRTSKEFIIVEQKENLFSLMTDFFYVPVIAVGKWLSEKFSQINVFIFVLDFIIEAPFKIIVEIAEEWTKYVKERKEEIE